MNIGIGIDTGGTYTDAVIYDFESKKILNSSKALTTKNDLSIGILEAIDSLPYDYVKLVKIVSLSTTLATNACVEGNGGSAKLIFLGGDKKVIDDLGRKYGLPPSNEIYIQESHTTISGDIKQDFDISLFNERTKDFIHFDGVGIIEMFAKNNGAVIEKVAKKEFMKNHNIPVVCGYELFSDLNCLQRGSSTLLNAQLFPVIKEFLEAINVSLKKRNIDPKVVMVRSDGSLMSKDFAYTRPVETLLCGPAASVIGAANLVNEQNCVIIDMGGTTSDIALIKEGLPVNVTDGINIGNWKTFVKGLYVHTFGLGGDSAIHNSNGKIKLEEYRVVPLCVISSLYPNIKEKLKDLLKNEILTNKNLHEFYVLVKEIKDHGRYTDLEIEFCNKLKNGPLTFTEAVNSIGKDVYTFNVDRLLKEGVVQICGLTPTDIMHIKNDFNKYDREASILGGTFVSSNLDVTLDELCDLVYNEVKLKMYVNVVKVLMQNNKNMSNNGEISEEIEKLIVEGYNNAKNIENFNILSFSIETNFTLIGLGAPIDFFIHDVAKLLNTKAIVPENHAVANALGAIISPAYVIINVEIKPVNTTEGTSGYTVFAKDVTKHYIELDDAKIYASSIAKELANEEVIARGAVGDIEINCTVEDVIGELKNGTIYLYTTVSACAIGSFTL